MSQPIQKTQKSDTWDNLVINDNYQNTIELNKSLSLKEMLSNLDIRLQEVTQDQWSHKGHCPFPDHNDSSPSFCANFKINKFNCFGCNKKGGPVQFISYLEKISVSEAIEQLKDNYLYIKKDKVIQEENNFINSEILEILLSFADNNFNFLKQKNFSDEAFEIAFNISHLSEFYIKHVLSNSSSFENLDSRLQLLSSHFDEFII